MYGFVVTAEKGVDVLVQATRDQTVLDVREKAAEILASVGSIKLRRIAIFRATKWAEASTEMHASDRGIAEILWAQAAEWLRIGWALPASATP